MFCVLLNNINTKTGKTAVFFYLSIALGSNTHSRRVNRRESLDLDDYLLTASGLIRKSVKAKFCLLFFPFFLL